MSTISASTTTTTAYKVTADTTGTLVFQTGATPTTAVTIGSDQSVVIQGLTVGKGAGAVATNTAVGASALASGLLSGGLNTAVGYVSLNGNTTGVNNSGFGYGTLASNTTGSNSVAVGTYALNNTTASNNTAVGYQAGYSNLVSQYNVFMGYQAGYTHNLGSLGNAFNCFVGNQAGYACTTGTNNTFIGAGNASYSCGGNMTTGSKNTIIGGYGGNQGGLDIRTASNYIVLSDGDGNPRGIFDGSGNFLVGTTSSITNGGYSFNVGTTSTAYLGHGSGAASSSYYQVFGYNGSIIGSITQNGTTGVLYNVASDYRLKNVIGAVTGFGERIDALEPIEYQWKSDGSNTRGFLAHKFQEVYPQSVSGEKDAVDEEGNPRYQNMQAGTSEVIADLVAEIQSIRKRLDAQAAEIATLKGTA